MKKVFVLLFLLLISYKSITSANSYDWKWSDPEGNDVYRFYTSNRVFLYSSPYQDIGHCYRKGKTKMGAPLLVREIPKGDWEFLSFFKVKVRHPETSFGLVLWDGGESQTYHILFGLAGRDRIALEGSLPEPSKDGSFFELPFSDGEGYLMIRKSKEEYYFYFRRDLNEEWRLLGRVSVEGDLFKYIGFFAKSSGEYPSSGEFYDWSFVVLREEPGRFKVKKALLYGVSNMDYVSASEELLPDGYGDGRFYLEIEGRGLAITAIEIRGYGVKGALWNTIPADGIPLVAVLDEFGNLLNFGSGSVNISMRGYKSLNLYVWDNGSINDERTKFDITFWLSDGQKLTVPVERELIYRRSLAVEECVILGIGPKDYVSEAEEIRADGKPDLHLVLRLKGEATITGIELFSVSGPNLRWDTFTGNSYPVIVLTDEKGHLFSAYDGSIYLKVKGEGTYHLWCYDKGFFNFKDASFRIVLSIADGDKVMAPVAKAWSR